MLDPLLPAATRSAMPAHGVPASVPGDLAEPGIDAPPATSIAELHERLRLRSAAIHDALRGGTIVQDGFLTASGKTGPPQRLVVTHETLGDVRAIGKSLVGNFPLAEQFANYFAERLGIGHLVAPHVERDGRVVIAMVPGVQAREASVSSAADLEALLRRFYETRLTGVPAEEIANRARIDRQLIQVFDHALAIADRHGRNLLVDADQGALTLIDHSELLYGHRTGAPLAPALMRRFQAGTHLLRPNPVVQLDDDVRALLRERVPPGTVDRMLDDLRAAAGGTLTPAAAGRLANADKARSIGARLNAAIETGALRSRYRAIPEFVMEKIGNLLDDSAALRRLFGLFSR